MLPYCQGINNSRNEENRMKNRLGKAVANAAGFSAKAACNSTSLIGLYQPVVPKQFKAEKKSKEK